MTWTFLEGWEEVDGFLDSIEKAFHSLQGQLPEKVRVAADHISWLLLTSLKCNMDKALQEAVQVH